MQHEPSGQLLAQRDDGELLRNTEEGTGSQEEYATRFEARASVFDDIERFYNLFPPPFSMGYLSPEQFEKAV